MARTQPYAQNCPIARTLDVIGDRWTLLIIRDLFLGRSRFNEFRQSTPRISPKLLSERLRRLEEDGLVERSLLDGRPPRAEYQLTEKGRAIFPVLFAIGTWGFEYLFADEPELRAEIDQYLRSAVPEYVTLSDTGGAAPAGGQAVSGTSPGDPQRSEAVQRATRNSNSA
jgi:DNA-binding HxlR family transcriptional regulator